MKLRYGFRTLAAVVLAICAQQAFAEDTIKIGVNMPLTGPVAASGNYIADGARIAADRVNAAGGVLGQKLELVIEDSKGNPTEAAAAAEKLITRDQVPVMMGAWSSTFTLAVMPKLMEYGVPMLVETSSSEKITKSGNPWVFRIAPTSSMEAKVFASKLGKFQIKKASFLVTNNDFGIGAAKEFSKALKEQGVEIGIIETMDPNAPDISAQLAKLKDTDSDTIFVTSVVEQITLVLRQAKDLRMTQHFITTGGSSAPDQLIQQAGAAANGSYHIVFFTPWFPEQTVNRDVATYLVEEWKKRGLDPAGLTEGFRGFDGILTIAEAIKQAGKAEPKAIQEALWKVRVKGANGDIAFNKDGEAGKESGQSSPNVYMIQIKDGKVAPVDF
ncbi:ABC transporter substrate-binding protein [Mesorhizobium sp. CO1-1-8]|uniref:ABC transporter substrate-binding protein n=1 Tax=Mesorhizobium sp. CO1-1-8 TaxID=2876631 RepID=UPI001CD13A37|nr:ABC transporter substrate-binding protein [Mesorhizobium sp. CO1-1-8]MBZ9772580.1 ABC transporter substrate-binding protein [Mesorhizobium sp. CO1-1-8]